MLWQANSGQFFGLYVNENVGLPEASQCTTQEATAVPYKHAHVHECVRACVRACMHVRVRARACETRSFSSLCRDSLLVNFGRRRACV